MTLASLFALDLDHMAQTPEDILTSAVKTAVCFPITLI